MYTWTGLTLRVVDTGPGWEVDDVVDELLLWEPLNEARGDEGLPTPTWSHHGQGQLMLDDEVEEIFLQQGNINFG